jgi:hypothetical protein
LNFFIMIINIKENNYTNYKYDYYYPHFLYFFSLFLLLRLRLAFSRGQNTHTFQLKTACKITKFFKTKHIAPA